MELKKKIAKLLGKRNPERSPKRTPINNRFFKVHNWMLKMSLTGYETMVYAFIHGYSSQGKGYCYRPEVLGGGVFGTSAETMDNIIGSLIGKGALIRDSKGLYWTNKKQRI